MATTKKPVRKSVMNRARIEPIRSRDELTAVVIETARLQLERDKTLVTRDERVAAVAEEFDLIAEDLGRSLTENTKRLKAWCVTHRADEFGTRQTIHVAGHELEFRKSPGKVDYLPGVKAGDALEAVLSTENEADVEKYTRVNASLDKAAVIKAWNESETARELLRTMGIEVVKPEEFKFSPRREDVPDASISGGKEDA